jgi:hypothetical protein
MCSNKTKQKKKAEADRETEGNRDMEREGEGGERAPLLYLFSTSPRFICIIFEGRERSRKALSSSIFSINGQCVVITVLTAGGTCTLIRNKVFCIEQ